MKPFFKSASFLFTGIKAAYAVIQKENKNKGAFCPQVQGPRDSSVL